MRSPRFAVLASLLLAAGLAACGTAGEDGPCADGLDNDEDGLIDEADPSCPSLGTEDGDDPVRDCNDGDDNDGDSLVDFPEDPGCTDGQDNSELNSPIPACNDGLDNDDDGLTDFPDDPGCSSELQNTEDDDCPDGVGCPECGNGVDDDEDGDVDYPADDGCSAASDPSERATDPTACAQLPHEPLPSSGLAAGVLISDASVTSSSTCGGAGSEVAYEIVVEEAVIMVATTDVTGTAFDSILYVRERCGDMTTELACNDDATPDTRRSTLTVALDPGTYYLIVDGDSAASAGGYQLKVEYFAGVGTDCSADPEICAAGTSCRTVEGASGPTCEFPICSDGRDDDDDLLIDFPFDPGCESTDDMDEADECGVVDGDCPACGNGLDDDGDLMVDYPMDMDCESAGQVVEGCATEADPIGSITGPVTTGTTTGLTNNFNGTCIGSAGPDKVYLLNLPVPVATLQIDTIGTASDFDTVLMLKTSACGTTDIACDDQSGLNNQALITRTNMAAGPYVVVVDGWLASDFGSFTLNVRGTVATGAACTGPLFANGALSCSVGEFCNGTVCTPSPCNDLIDDDGDGDGTNYPGDPGCTSISDASEEDTCPLGDCPRCGNGMDDDGDGAIDSADPNCVSASTNDESGCASTNDAYLPITGPTVTGSFATANGNDFDPTCHASSGRDLAYELNVPFPLESLYLDTNGSTVNTTLSMKVNGCNAAATEVFCDQSSGDDSTDAYKVLGATAAGRYAVIVDSVSGTTGAFVLNVRGVIAEDAACSPALEAAGLFVCNATSHCAGTAGAEVCTPFACSDGDDNDGDLKGDATDPGCLSGADDSETDPGTLPQCADTINNDGDASTDYPADSGCRRASDPLELTCADAGGVTEITTAHTFATNVGAGADHTAGCIANSAGAPDKIFSVTVPGTMSTLRFNAELAVPSGSYDRVMYVRKDQCTTDYVGACADFSDLTLTNATAGTYFVFVDGYNTGSGSFHLLVKGTIASGQACDPAQIQAGMFSCAAGTSCIGNVCQ